MSPSVVPSYVDDVAHNAFLRRVRADLKAAAATLSEAEARYLVDLYYQQQDNRTRSANQVRSTNEPNALITWLADEHRAIENLIKTAMDAYTETHLPGRWMKSITGIGPVLAAGFFATIDIEKAKTAGSIWRFAGLDPSRTWLKADEIKKILEDTLGRSKRGEQISPADVTRVCEVAKMTPTTVLRDATIDFKTGKTTKLTRDRLAKALARRPWNRRLKVLAWKFGDCQKKFHNHKNSFYGPLYVEYKNNLIARNERGEFVERALEKSLKVGKGTEAYKHLKNGKLPPGHIDAMALRWIAKLFLSHLHTVMWVDRYGTQSPKPYVIAHLDHVHMIDPPNWPMK